MVSGVTRRGTAHLVDMGAEVTLVPGTILQDRYEIIDTAGSGGMAIVYKARDLRFEKASRICAVKEMFNTVADARLRDLYRQQFDREANVLASLNHPAVLKVFDYFSEGERVYLVTDFVEGKNLEQIITNSDGPIEQEKVIDWAIQVCDVLSYLHNHKPDPVIFRDLKPSNVMLNEFGRVVMIDFGIAKVFQGEQRGTMIGTEGYTPPEQYRGAAEPRGDLYALGATMHHLLTKHNPQEEPPFTFHERPIRQLNPQVSEGLEAVVMRSLEYEIDKRFASAEELKQALLLLSRPVAVVSAPGGVPARMPVGGTPSTVAFATSTLSFSETGNVLPIWEFACEDEITSSPQVSDGVLYIGSYDHNLYAINAQEGTFLWKYPSEEGIASSPCVWEHLVFFGSEDRMVYALAKDAGRIMWTSPTRDRIRSSPRVAMSHVFVGSDDHCLYNLDARNGRQVWRFEVEDHIRSSPCIYEGIVYFGSDDSNVYAVDIQTGRLKWKCSVNRPVLSSPAAHEGMIFVGSMDWNLYAIDAQAGWVVWKARTKGRIISSPAVSEPLGLVYIGSQDGNVYAYDYSKGREVWRAETGGPIGSSPAVTLEAVYIGSADKHLYSFDARTGDLRWKFAADSGIVSTPAATNDMIYAASRSGRVYAFLP